MNLEDINVMELNDWILARKEVGDEEYGDEHMERYCLLDVAEELIDALIILDKWYEKNEQFYEDDIIDDTTATKLSKSHTIMRNQVWTLLDQITIYDRDETVRGRKDTNSDERVYFEK